MAVLVGCSSNSSNDTANQGADTAGAEMSGAANGADGAAGLDTVFYFDFDQYTLKPEAREALVAHADVLKAAPRSVRLEGHADERGTREYNMALGERRANAVRDFLVLQGVNGADLEVISYGEERPAATGSDDASWSANRRVEMK